MAEVKTTGNGRSCMGPPANLRARVLRRALMVPVGRPTWPRRTSSALEDLALENHRGDIICAYQAAEALLIRSWVSDCPS
jgi:hypothetical protein